MATKILFSPKQPDAILDIAAMLTPARLRPGGRSIPGTPRVLSRPPRTPSTTWASARQMGGEFFRSAPKLKLVQLLSAGYDRVDIEAARKAKVPVANNGGANAIAVAEHTLHADARRAQAAGAVPQRRRRRQVAGGRPRRHAGLRARRAHASASSASATSARRSRGGRRPSTRRCSTTTSRRLTEDQEDALGVRFALFTELLQTADVVSLHVPLDDSTRKMIGARELALMKPTAIIVNTCRGPVIDEDALYTALKDGQHRGRRAST